MLQRKLTLLGVAGFMLATLTLPAEAANIYKYIDKDGRTVFNAFIPAEYVKNGYTILNEQGQVLQVVPRAATEEELNAQQAAKAAEAEQLAARIAQAEADKLLLRLFRAPDEIVRKRDNTLEQLSTQQSITQVSISNADEEIVRVQTIIDNATKNGQTVLDANLRRLENSKLEKANQQAHYDKLEADKAKVVADAERDFRRLHDLMGLPQGVMPPPPSAEATTPSAEQAAPQ